MFGLVAYLGRGILRHKAPRAETQSITSLTLKIAAVLAIDALWHLNCESKASKTWKERR